MILWLRPRRIQQLVSTVSRLRLLFPSKVALLHLCRLNMPRTRTERSQLARTKCGVCALPRWRTLALDGNSTRRVLSPDQDAPSRLSSNWTGGSRGAQHMVAVGRRPPLRDGQTDGGALSAQCLGDVQLRHAESEAGASKTSGASSSSSRGPCDDEKRWTLIPWQREPLSVILRLLFLLSLQQRVLR